jgi:hypothetical protein
MLATNMHKCYEAVYNKGIELGLQKGKLEGIELGLQKGKHERELEIARNMHS